MKKLAGIPAAALAVLSAAVPFSASAAEDLIYGTMNIPYTDFYAAETGDSAGEVDAVTSATKNKVLMNEEGKLFEGTFNNGEDTILGVTYPVAVSQADLDALGADNYGFTRLDTVPEAYKTVTVADGKAKFSAVQDANPETAALGVKLSTETPWGDYLIDLTEQPEGFDIQYRGALLKTADGKVYPMRHEQNIWRGELAWSSGIKTEEPHGNKLDYKLYEGLMGSTVKEIVLITKKGYVTVSTDTYIPIKFACSLTVQNAEAGTGSTDFAAEGIPSDYQQRFSVAEGFTAADGKIAYTDAKPGSYKLTLSDEGRKYADVNASFVLETDALPVQFKDGRLAAAEGFTDEDAQNFIDNLVSYQIGEAKYNATGKGSVRLFKEDGTIDFDAKARDAAVFADGADGSYTLQIAATGYRNALTVQLAPAPAETTVSSESQSTQTSSTAGTNAAGDTQNVPAPKAGDSRVGVIAALASAAAAAVLLSRKKRRS